MCLTCTGLSPFKLSRFIAAFATLCGWHYKIECSFHRCVCKSLRLNDVQSLPKSRRHPRTAAGGGSAGGGAHSGAVAAQRPRAVRGAGPQGSGGGRDISAADTAAAVLVRSGGGRRDDRGREPAAAAAADRLRALRGDGKVAAAPDRRAATGSSGQDRVARVADRVGRRREPAVAARAPRSLRRRRRMRRWRRPSSPGRRRRARPAAAVAAAAAQPAPATPPRPRSPVRFRPGSAWSERDDARRRNQQRLSTGSNASAASVEKVLEACEETARAVASPNAEGRRIQRLFDDVCGVRKGTKALDALALRLKADETLLRARATRCGPKVYDGASVLHAAAFHGQLHVIEAVLAIEESPLDPWTLDTAGRTALHVAAERGHVGCCDALRKAMSASQDDPVGENAPMDMSGRTPCAWAAERVKDAQKRDALEATLFSPGDATVLPRRSEKSHAAHAVSSTAGWRVVMEDAHCVCRLDGATLYAVFDGHGGSLVANYAAANIERCLQLSEDPAASLKNALATLDAELAEHPRLVKSRRSGRGGTGPLVAEDESGATALLCLVTQTQVVVAHLGDSRGALLRKQGGKWSSQNLTPADHTAGSPAEAARIDSLQNFGVLRRENDAPRVARKVDGAVVENGALQTTRALGDFVFKTATERAVTCEADARALSLQECRGGERSCVLLACDGLWDVLTGEECGAILDSCVEGLDAQCDALVAECVRRRSRDNVTAILVDLDASAAAEALAFGGGTPPEHL